MADMEESSSPEGEVPMEKPETQESLLESSPKKNIVLGVVDTTGMKSCIPNRKRRWDQSPVDTDAGVSKDPPEKKLLMSTEPHEASAVNLDMIEKETMEDETPDNVIQTSSKTEQMSELKEAPAPSKDECTPSLNEIDNQRSLGGADVPCSAKSEPDLVSHTLISQNPYDEKKVSSEAEVKGVVVEDSPVSDSTKTSGVQKDQSEVKEPVSVESSANLISDNEKKQESIKPCQSMPANDAVVVTSKIGLVSALYSEDTSPEGTLDEAEDSNDSDILLNEQSTNYFEETVQKVAEGGFSALGSDPRPCATSDEPSESLIKETRNDKNNFSISKKDIDDTFGEKDNEKEVGDSLESAPISEKVDDLRDKPVGQVEKELNEPEKLISQTGNIDPSVMEVIFGKDNDNESKPKESKLEGPESVQLSEAIEDSPEPTPAIEETVDFEGAEIVMIDPNQPLMTDTPSELSAANSVEDIVEASARKTETPEVSDSDTQNALIGDSVIVDVQNEDSENRQLALDGEGEIDGLDSKLVLNRASIEDCIGVGGSSFDLSSDDNARHESVPLSSSGVLEEEPSVSDIKPSAGNPLTISEECENSDMLVDETESVAAMDNPDESPTTNVGPETIMKENESDVECAQIIEETVTKTLGNKTDDSEEISELAKEENEELTSIDSSNNPQPDLVSTEKSVPAAIDSSDHPEEVRLEEKEKMHTKDITPSALDVNVLSPKPSLQDLETSETDKAPGSTVSLSIPERVNKVNAAKSEIEKEISEGTRQPESTINDVFNINSTSKNDIEVEETNESKVVLESTENDQKQALSDEKAISTELPSVQSPSEVVNETTEDDANVQLKSSVSEMLVNEPTSEAPHSFDTSESVSVEDTKPVEVSEAVSNEKSIASVKASDSMNGQATVLDDNETFLLRNRIDDMKTEPCDAPIPDNSSSSEDKKLSPHKTDIQDILNDDNEPVIPETNISTAKDHLATIKTENIKEVCMVDVTKVSPSATTSVLPEVTIKKEIIESVPQHGEDRSLPDGVEMVLVKQEFEEVEQSTIEQSITDSDEMKKANVENKVRVVAPCENKEESISSKTGIETIKIKIVQKDVEIVGEKVVTKTSPEKKKSLPVPQKVIAGDDSKGVAQAIKGKDSKEGLAKKVDLSPRSAKTASLHVYTSGDNVRKDELLLKTVDSSKDKPMVKEPSKGNTPEKHEPITLRIFKESLSVVTEGLDSPDRTKSPKSSELRCQLSPHIKATEQRSPSKMLDFTLKICKDAHTNEPKATMSPKSLAHHEKVHSEQGVRSEKQTPISSNVSDDAVALDFPSLVEERRIEGSLMVEGTEGLMASPGVRGGRGRGGPGRKRGSRRGGRGGRGGHNNSRELDSPPEKRAKIDSSESMHGMLKKILESNHSTPMSSDGAGLSPLVTPTPKKRGRPRKNLSTTPIPMVEQSLSETSLLNSTSGSTQDSSGDTPGSLRPMRSCRDRTKPIIFKTRKPRGGGRRGGRGGGNTSLNIEDDDIKMEESKSPTPSPSPDPEEVKRAEEAAAVAAAAAAAEAAAVAAAAAERALKKQQAQEAADREALSAKEKAELAKIEARKAKARAERMAKNERIKAKKLAKKLKDEERRKRIQREKAEAAAAAALLEEETRMSAPDGLRYDPARFNHSRDLGDESQSSTNPYNYKKNRMEITIDPECEECRVDQLAEYQWQGSELFMIQEQVSLYLGVKSFKRKYPDLKRRNVEAEERSFLEESGLVPKSMCDLGLTAVSSAEILDIMYIDFPDKYEEFRRHVREKQAREASFKQRAFASAIKFGKAESREQALESAAMWNANLNRERKDERRCALDLQTFTIHYPRSKREHMSVPTQKVGLYPISLVPGQYCDYYKSYTPTELMYFPLNSVMYGPLKPNERHKAGSDGSGSDSDDSSSDDSSDSSSNGSKSSGEEQDEPKCKSCSGTKKSNKEKQPEVLISCGQCKSYIHPSCQDLTVGMVPHIQKYNWQCTDCKTCTQCKDLVNEDKLLFCDLCDRGYHIYCVGLRKVPDGRWHCNECNYCHNCETRDPGGTEWSHEYKKEKGNKIYQRTLCSACSKLWRKGKYCQVCLRCHSLKPEEEAGLHQCNTCDRWIHRECLVSRYGINPKGQRALGFQCEQCQERVQTVINNHNSPAKTPLKA